MKTINWRSVAATAKPTPSANAALALRSTARDIARAAVREILG